MLLLLVYTFLTCGTPINGLSGACIASLCGGNNRVTNRKYNLTEIQVKSGENVTLQCPPGYRYSWIEPTLEKRRQRCDYIIEKYQEDAVGQQEQTLFLPKVTYAHSGLYTCAIKLPNIYGFYVYVRDENVLSLSNTRTYSADVMVKQDEVANIPCVPTSLDVNVDLFIGNSVDPISQKMIPTNTPIDENMRMYTFDPQSGFYTNDTNLLGMRIYTCKFTRGNREETLTSRLIVTALDYTVPFVYVSEISNKENRLILECKYDSLEDFTIEWITPQKSSDKRIHKFNFKETTGIRDESVSWFIVSNTDKRDEGFYYCKISKNDQDFLISDLYVTVS